MSQLRLGSPVGLPSGTRSSSDVGGSVPTGLAKVHIASSPALAENRNVWSRLVAMLSEGKS